MLRKTLKKVGKPLIPLRPVVIPRCGVELVLEMPLREQRRERAVRGQQTFLFTASQKKVWRLRGVRGPRQDERIVVVL